MRIYESMKSQYIQFKKSMVLLAALCFSLSFSHTVLAQETTYGALITSGDCGENTTYAIYDSDADDRADMIVFAGSGATDDYSTYTDEQNVKQADTPYKDYVGDIKKVVVGKDVTVLGERTCYKMINLEEVVFETESSLTGTERNVFYGCAKLKKIEIPKSVTTLGLETFGSCAGLEEVVFLSNETLTSIGGYCFSNCSSLVDMVLPDSVTTIGEFAFQKCIAMESIKLPEKLEGELEAAFYQCEKLKKIEIPDGVTVLGLKAFYQCYALEEVIFSENTHCHTLEDQVFYDCDALTSLTIPTTIKKIGSRTVEHCSNLNTVIIETSQLTAEDVYGSLIVFSEIKTIIYPEKYMDNDSEVLKKLYSSIDGVETQLATTEEEDGTISVKVISIPEGANRIDCPMVIAGKNVSKITFADGINGSTIVVGCHVNSMKADASGHWQEESVCSVCNQKIEKIEKVAHQYEEGEVTCSCGYVKPVEVTESPASITLTYGYSKYRTLSAAYEKRAEASVYFYWTENGEVVKEGDTQYNFVTRKEVGEYIVLFCIETQKYQINGTEVEGSAYQYIAQSEPAIITVKKRPITVRVSDISRYAGDENPQFSVEVVSGGLAYEDTIDDLALDFNTAATQTSACGEYEITAVSGSSNYEVTVLPGVLTVQERPSSDESASNTGSGNNTENGSAESEGAQKEQTQTTLPKEGDKLSTSSAVYRVVKQGDLSGKIGEVTYVKPLKKTVKRVTIPSTVTIGGIQYKVTAIGANAFKKCTKLKKVTIGKYVSKIGKKAFYKCKKLKTIVIKTKKLSAKKVGSKAFKGINKRATIKVPKSKYKTYKKWLKKKGVGASTVYKKI